MFTAGQLTSLAVWLWLILSSLASATNQSSPGTYSPHGNLNIPCQNCHTANGWKPIRAIPEFNHDQTRYPLRGLHQRVACTQCHAKPVFRYVGTRCQDCHADIHKRQLGANCEQCHSVRGWQVAIKDIQQHNNRFPLTGAHAALDCAACHKNEANSRFQIMSTACYSCHAADFKKTQAPNHVALGYSTSCEQCHSSDNWLNAKFDHNSVGFPLSGAHAVPPRACDDCHKNNNFNLTTTTCVSCHQTDYNNANSPPHKEFPTACQQCHDTIQWSDGKFDHSQTGFPLTGMHTVPPRRCADCHKNNNYNITNTACYSCHQADFTAAKNPDHVAGGFSQNCETCHTTAAWQPAQFDHSKSGFPLTGSHMVPPRACADCHVNNNYNITDTTCISCHQTDYQNAKSPVPHTGFPTTCQKCHDTIQWTDGKFDHSQTGFPLTGQHIVPPRQCTDCHVNSNYNLTSTACYSCHQKDFQGAKNPDHVTGGFPQNCEVCHTTSAWQPAQFDHSKSGFPLTGSHTVPPRQCADCHVNSNYNITNTACISCHQTDYNNAKSPVPHTGFPTTCEQCHDTVQWTDGKFDHSQTGFPLTGSHTVPPRACTDCHVNNNYNLNSNLCISCHQKDFQNANDPPHSGFPTTCELCHDTVQWSDGKFDHSQTGFPLTGSHTVPPRACSDCHVNNNYKLNSNLCITCHQIDYQNATNPGHAAQPQFFPTTCQNCHGTTNWLNATFNHAQFTPFPITHGNANGVCATCHTNSNDYSVFQCTNCHAKTETDGNHRDVKGYVYNSVNCYQCHRDGHGGG